MEPYETTDGKMTIVKAVNEDFDPATKSLYKVGDSFTIDLGDLFGKQTATVQEVKQNGAAVLLFDNILTERPINSERTNVGGFGPSDLNSWLHDTLLPVISKDTGANISEITLPTYSQIFDHYDWYHNTFVPDQDEQWPLMKKERRAKLNGKYYWYWLKNATRKEFSASHFALVHTDGNAYAAGAPYYYGVRPCFIIEPL